MMSRNAIVCAACASIKRTSSIFDPKDGITKFSVTMSSNNVDSRFSLHGFNRLSAITNTIISTHISQRFKKANASTAKTNPLRRFAFLNRWEMCVEIIVFVIAESRLNPWREKRLSTLLLLIVTLNFVMPSLGSKMLDVRFIEAQAAHTIAFLDIMQMHYLFVLAVVPKIAENLFGTTASTNR